MAQKITQKSKSTKPTAKAKAKPETKVKAKAPAKAPAKTVAKAKPAPKAKAPVKAKAPAKATSKPAPKAKSAPKPKTPVKAAAKPKAPAKAAPKSKAAPKPKAPVKATAKPAAKPKAPAKATAKPAPKPTAKKATPAPKPPAKKPAPTKPNPPFKWSATRISQLKKMWMNGDSASDIAATFGGLSRNAIIGKVYRLGLSNLNASAKAKADKKGKAAHKVASKTALPTGQNNKLPLRRPTAARAGQPLPPQPALNEISEEVLQTAAEALKKAKKLTLMELTERTCKWPVGDPSTDDFWFCGLDAVAGKPYCEAHNAVAFHPPNLQRRMRSRG